SKESMCLHVRVAAPTMSCLADPTGTTIGLTPSEAGGYTKLGEALYLAFTRALSALVLRDDDFNCLVKGLREFPSVILGVLTKLGEPRERLLPGQLLPGHSAGSHFHRHWRIAFLRQLFCHLFVPLSRT